MEDSDQPAKSAENQQTELVCSFFRKPVNKKNIRKRTIVNEDNEEDSNNETSLLHIQKKTLKPDNKLYFSTGSSKSSASAEPSEEPGKPVFQFESSKEIQVQHDSKATATLETETEFSKDARAIRERALKQAEESLKGKSPSSKNEKLYKGMNSYKDYKAGFRREQTIASEKAGGSHGPLRASAHIRVSARFDYQPDICKDYKETGYCGYGDSCKFMHDRGDYKSGWQMEKEWEEAEKARKMRLAAGEDADEEGANLTDEDDEDSLPFACFICRNTFVDPVVTKCKHYFCEHCALKHHAKNKKCFVCNQPTLGIFNVAHEIRRKMAGGTVSFFLSFFSSLLCNTISLHLVQTLSFFSCRKKNQIYPLTMLQEMWNAPPGLRPSKSAPCSPAKPLGVVPRTRSESFHVAHKVPVGDTPYVRAKNVQLVDKDPERAIPLFWAAINAGDRVDSALKDMAIVMKQQNRAEEAIEAIKSLRSRCSDQAQESLDNILLDLYKRCGRLDDQIGLLKHKLYLIQQGLAFNGKRTKTARSQGKKFQVSVEQEATRLLGNLGWALMQQNNYIEAEDAYRRALSIAPDNNKMCNLGICLMKQGRIGEAKETLYRVKPAVMDGPRGSDSHLKAYERAQQMLKDLESEMMNKGVDRIEQSRLFEAFLGSSSIWQPQPCKDHHHTTTLLATTTINSAKIHDEFADENINSNIMLTNHTALPPSKGSNNNNSNKQVGAILGNSLNVAAPPFYASKSSMLREPIENQLFSETLKRTRSGNAAGSMRVVSDVRDANINNKKLHVELGVPVPQNKSRRLSSEDAAEKNKLTDLLPNDDEFEEAILAAILGAPNESDKAYYDTGSTTSRMLRLKVFQDITLSLSPRA